MKIIQFVNDGSRQAELTDMLCKASAAYYGGETPLMTDHEFDWHMKALIQLENESGFAYNNSPTVAVGASVVGELQKSTHEEPALSLGKVKYESREELIEWLGNKDGILSWKMDGLTVVATYDGGKLTKAVTRGNGEVGSDITHNAVYFEGLPTRINYDEHLVVRGECVMTHSEFERVNEESGGIYENPRNLASATIQMLDSKESRKRQIKFYAFEQVAPTSIESFSQRMKFLYGIGINTVEFASVRHDDLLGTIEEFKKKVNKNDFPTDGLVLTYDDTAYAASLGSTGHHPRGSIAMKWTDETVSSTVRRIEWSVGRTGVITPVAVFDTVRLGLGSNVSRASLHNLSIAQAIPSMDHNGKCTCGVGSKVEVYLANMIIPMVAQCTDGVLDVPDRCPVCGGETTIKNNNGVQTLVCENKDCPAKHIKTIAVFASKGGMNIDGLSEAKINFLLSNGFVKTPLDFYKLKNDKMLLKRLELADGWGKKSVENLLNAIEASRDTDLEHFICALGIPLCGHDLSKKLAKLFDYDIGNLLSFATTPVPEMFAEVAGIGSVKAESVAKYFTECNVNEFEKLIAELRFKMKDTSKRNDNLKGLNFVITGSVHHFKNRDEFKQFVEDRGGKVIGSVSANINYLVNNDSTSNSSKNKKAKELGITIITEQQFLEMFGDE